jgi:hypothetical protein
MPFRTTSIAGLTTGFVLGLTALPPAAVPPATVPPAASLPAAVPAARAVPVATALPEPVVEQEVRLLTGDRVVLNAAGRPSYGQVLPGPGRRDMKFLTYRYAGRVEVIPADVLPQVTSGRLDRRLFDVRGLRAAGYHDARQAAADLARTARPHPTAPIGSREPASAAGSVDPAPAALSYAVQRWPHADDRPRARVLTYRNSGSEPLRLSLRAELAGPDGRPAPPGALRLGAERIQVAPGGKARVRVVVDTRHGGPDGRYTGRVVATSGSTAGGSRRFVTPVSVLKEPESYDLTIRHLDRSGARTDAFGDLVFGLDHDVLDFPMGHGDTTRLRLPKGRYHVESTVQSGDPDDPDFHTVVRPLLTLDRDITVTVDARVTRPVSISLPRQSARLALVDLAYIRKAPNGRTLQSGILSRRVDDTFTAHQGPNVPAAALVDRIHTQWAEPDGKGGFAGTPYVYGLFWVERGRYPTGFTRRVRSDELARVTSHHASDAAHVSEHDALRFLAPRSTDGIGGWSVGLPVGLPSTLTAHLSADDVRWSGTLIRTSGTGSEQVDETWLSSTWQTFAAGRAYHDRWNTAVLGPAMTGATATLGRSRPSRPSRGRPVGRMVVDVPMYADQTGNVGGSRTDHARTTLHRGGMLVRRSQVLGQGRFAVSPGPARYRLAVSATRRTVSRLSTRVEAVWTFRAAAPEAGRTRVPLSVVRFGPRVDDHNRVDRGRAALVPVTVQRNGRATPGVQRLTVQQSSTDGRTWSKVPVVRLGPDRWVAVVTAGRSNAGFVSLRASVVDHAGNQSRLTVVRAYAVR